VAGSPWRRRLAINWQVVLLSIVLNLVLLAALAAPVAFLERGLVEVAHRFDARVPALAYGAVRALVYAAGLVRAFVKLEIEFSPRR
jgi:hypothetical protein